MTAKKAEIDRAAGSRIVKALALVFLLAGVECSRSTDRSAPTSSNAAPSSTTTTLSRAVRAEMTVTTTGEPFGLRVDGDAVSFCDERGGRKLDATIGQDAAFERTCVKDGEANTACGGLALDAAVSTPNRGPNDVVDVKGSTFPLDGRVHDCAAAGEALAVVTGSTVVLIDTTKDKANVIDHEGGDRVAIGAEWVAWSRGSTVHERKR